MVRRAGDLSKQEQRDFVEQRFTELIDLVQEHNKDDSKLSQTAERALTHLHTAQMWTERVLNEIEEP
jgi:hypothetical protein